MFQRLNELPDLDQMLGLGSGQMVTGGPVTPVDVPIGLRLCVSSSISGFCPNIGSRSPRHCWIWPAEMVMLSNWMYTVFEPGPYRPDDYSMDDERDVKPNSLQIAESLYHDASRSSIANGLKAGTALT